VLFTRYEAHASDRATEGYAGDAQQAAGTPNSGEANKFVTHIFQARKHYRLICERPNKGNKAIEREIIANFQVAQSLGFKGDFRQWEHLLRIHE
jgi:hypothetical protein